MSFSHFQSIRPWTNGKCLATKHHQTTKHFNIWTPCLVLFDRVWSCLIKCEGHQTFDLKLNTVLLFSCLMGDVLFVWTAAYQTCLNRACVPRLLSGLYQLFDLCLIKHVLTVWPLIIWSPNNVWWCLVAKHAPFVEAFTIKSIHMFLQNNVTWILLWNCVWISTVCVDYNFRANVLTRL